MIFSLFKFHCLNTILNEPQNILIFEDGDVKGLSNDAYKKLYINRPKHIYIPPHINLPLIDFVIKEYPNYNLEQDFKINKPLESGEKLKLLYFLRTGDFESMRIKISDSDISYIENTGALVKNKEISQAISKWNFEEIIISIDNELDTIIKPKS